MPHEAVKRRRPSGNAPHFIDVNCSGYHLLSTNLKSLLSVIGDNLPWNKYDISIGGWGGTKSQIRYDNADATEYLKELPHTWTDYDGMRWNTIFRVLDGTIQFIFDGDLSYVSMQPRGIFFEYNDDKIEKTDLKYLRISSWSSTPVPYEGLKWSFIPKIISTGKVQKDTDCIS